MFRVVALGLIALAMTAFAGYRLGTTQEPSRQGLTSHDVRDVIAVPEGRPSGEGFGAGSIWVPLWSMEDITIHGDGSVARYDPATRRMLAKIHVGSQPLAAQPGFGSMWVTNAGDGTVTRIDPSLNVVMKTIRVGPVPYQIAPAGGGMWVATQNAAVKIDPTTNRVVRRTPYPHPPNSEPPSTAGVALDANSHGVWVSTAFGTVLRLRPSDGRLLAKIRVQPVPRSSPGMVAIDGHNVWVSNYAIEGGIGPTGGGEVYGPSNHLVDISSLTNKIVARVPTAGYPVESFLPHNNTLLMVGVDYMQGKSVLIRTDWPYRTLTYVRALGASSFGVVDVRGFLWIPSFKERALQIIPDSEGLSNSPYQGG